MPESRSLEGYGQQVGPLRPDWGKEWADLACDQCGATWTGPIGDPCWWCARSRQRMREWQAEKVLEAPEEDPDDSRYDGVMAGWAVRLAVAVEAGLISQHQADNAWRRAVHRAA